MWSRRGLVAIVTLCAAAAWAGEPPVPSGPHPRLFLRPADLAGHQLRARLPGSAASKLIERCQRSIDRPDEVKDRGGVDGDYWPGTTMACAFAYRATGQRGFLVQALKFWRVSLNDDQVVGDGKGCTAEQVAGGPSDWRKSWKGESPVPPALITVAHDTWYPMRWYGPYIALTYDWLYGDADEALRQQTRRCLTGWIDGYTRFGYLRDEPGANYHAGFVIGKTLAAIAIGTDGGADDHLWTETLRELFAKQLVGKGLAGSGGGLGQPAGLLVGGDWGSWQYGPLSVLEYAIATRAVQEQGAPQPEMVAWLRSVMLRSLYGMVPRMDRQFAGNGDYEGEGDYAVYQSVEATQLDAALAGPSTDQVAGWAAYVRQSRRLTGSSVWNALAELRTVAPQDYRAQKPAPPLWYLARGVGNLYVRTSWREDAFWAVFMSGTPRADHAHYAASNFVFSRGADHLIVDSSNYTQFGTLGGNGVSADTSAPEGYALTQGPWGEPTMPWVRASGDGVFAARSDFARGFEYRGAPSEIKYAHRDWVLLPEGEIVAIDRVLTGDPGRNMYVSFHANTGGTLAFDLPPGGSAAEGRRGVGDGASGVASGKVAGSRLAIHRVVASGGAPKIVKTKKSDCPGDCRYPCGRCTAARFDVDVYTAAVPGPFAIAVHVIDGLGADEAPAQVSALDDARVDPGKQNAGVVGAAVLRGSRQSYVIASRQAPGSRPPELTYGVPGAAAARHVVFDAPEAKDGTSSITASVAAGRCAVRIAPGAGGGASGRPLIFEMASAGDGCTVKMAADAPGAAPIGPSRGEVSEMVSGDARGPSGLRHRLYAWYLRLRVPALGATLVLLAFASILIVARRRRRASAS